ncbi:MAG: TonB-dependent receptor [Flavobacteriia bacterium]|nr:TonB-dependent receptor [Flavobacteriia bacterium]
MFKSIFTTALLLCFTSIYAQNVLNGKVVDDFGHPLEEVRVIQSKNKITTDHRGEFRLYPDQNENIQIEFQLEGFETLNVTIDRLENKLYKFVMNYETVELDAAQLHHHHLKSVQNSERITAETIKNNYSGSLAQSIETIPGIQSSEIGSAASKPMIRGMGLNRVAVAENGLKQEGQQWGEEHGLEISSWNIDQIDILKGPAALEYGSDAVGGVIAVNSSQKPLIDGLTGELNLFGRTNNESLGTALKISDSKNGFYYKASADYSDYADFSVPTDHIVNQGEEIPLYKKRLPNTAGNNHSVSFLGGFSKNNFETSVFASNFHQKIGFFPGAHGDSDEEFEDDGNRRNIDYPYQNVNHFKLQSITNYKTGKDRFSLILGYQNNHRQEWDEPHDHSGEDHDEEEHEHGEHGDENLELDLRLSTYDAQLKYERNFSSKNKLNLGIQTQIQNNLIDGFSFLMPEYDRWNYSAYAINEIEIIPSLTLNYGLRFDYSRLKIADFFDSNLYEQLIESGYSDSEAEQLSQKSTNIDKKFSNLNYSAGLLFQPDSNWDLNLNLSSSFRLPNAIELASNGVHHGSFIYEMGNPDLKTEKGLTADFKTVFHKNQFQIGLNPYLYYFSNYIFLQPTVEISPLPDGNQIYRYSQAEALISGFEFSAEKNFGNRLNGLFSVEYQYNYQKLNQQKQPLPMSPPTVWYSEWTYQLIQNKKKIEKLELSADFKFADKQNRVAENEEPTDGYFLIGFGISSKFKFGKLNPTLIFKVRNLTNEKYFNHLSFYRNLEIPEAGRNFQLMLSIPF